jgi:hypothetical protein
MGVIFESLAEQNQVNGLGQGARLRVLPLKQPGLLAKDQLSYQPGVNQNALAADANQPRIAV